VHAFAFAFAFAFACVCVLVSLRESFALHRLTRGCRRPTRRSGGLCSDFTCKSTQENTTKRVIHPSCRQISNKFRLLAENCGRKTHAPPTIRARPKSSRCVLCCSHFPFRLGFVAREAFRETHKRARSADNCGIVPRTDVPVKRRENDHSGSRGRQIHRL
jgi:hypothetical protein